MSPLRWRTGAAGRTAIASLPIMRMNWRRRRANSLRSMLCRLVQPLRGRGRIHLLAQRQQLLEHHLRRHSDELDQLGIRLLVRFVRVRLVARGARDLGEVAYDLADVAIQALEVRDVPRTEAVQ